MLREAISYGDYYLSNRLIIGKALDDAAYIHDNLKWIGVSLSPSISEMITNVNNINTNSAIMYNDIPLKKSVYRGLVLNWPIDESAGECYSILQSERIIAIDQSVKEKYDNTIKFYFDVINGKTYTF